MTDSPDKKRFVDHAFRELRKLPPKHMRSIHEELNAIIEQEWNSISVGIFEQEFLPLFVQGIVGNEARFQNWLSVAGNIRFGVHLHDNVDPEVRIITVPPLYDTSMFNPTAGQGGDSIATHAAMYDALVRNRPHQAAAYFDNKMLDTLEAKFQSPTSKYWKMYADLLRHFGHDFLAGPGAAPAPAVTSSQATPVIINSADDVL